MRFRTLFAIVIVILVSAFLIVNWSAFSAPAKFNLLLSTVELPVGAVMLALFTLVLVTLAAYVGYWQTTLLIEYRRQTKELQAQRTLADNAEASRLTDMANLLRGEMSALGTRFEQSIAEMRQEFRHAENSINAVLGEMDDRLRRITPAARA